MADKIFIDASDSPIGRISSYAAKQALIGSRIFVLNCEKAVISGKKKTIIRERKQKRARGGTAQKGPYHSKDSEKIMKRCIRGMLPDYRHGRGKEAWKRVKCFVGLPNEYKNEKLTKIKAKILPRYLSLGELKKEL